MPGVSVSFANGKSSSGNIDTVGMLTLNVVPKLSYTILQQY